MVERGNRGFQGAAVSFPRASAFGQGASVEACRHSRAHPLLVLCTPFFCWYERVLIDVRHCVARSAVLCCNTVMLWGMWRRLQ